MERYAESYPVISILIIISWLVARELIGAEWRGDPDDQRADGDA